MLACTPEQCTCRACGQQTTVIGYDRSEQLDVEPARYFVLVTKREKRACPFCQEGGIATASLATRIIDKGLASDRVVIDAVVAKYSDHLPLYRQSAILERETGLEISRATLDGWVMRVGELLCLLPRPSVVSWSVARISKQMKRQWACRCTTDEAKTIRPTCGNTAGPAAT